MLQLVHTQKRGKFRYKHSHYAQLALVSKSITLRRVSQTRICVHVCYVRCNSLQTGTDLLPVLASSISPASSQQKIDKYAVQVSPRAEFYTISTPLGYLPHFWYQNVNTPLLPLVSTIDVKNVFYVFYFSHVFNVF